jgi:hypothetical protein
MKEREIRNGCSGEVCGGAEILSPMCNKCNIFCCVLPTDYLRGNTKFLGVIENKFSKILSFHEISI